MPIQTWTPGQQLTAAELTTVTNMLPAPQVATANVASAVSGTMYRCQPGGGSITITLPVPTLGTVIGMTLDSSTGSCTLAHNATELIYGVDEGTTRGVTSLTLVQPDAYVVAIADGTNWHEYGTMTSGPWKFFDTTLGSTASSITIPASGSIPSGWSSLEVDIYSRSNTAANVDTLAVRVNGDTSSTNYNSEFIVGNGNASPGSNQFLATSSWSAAYMAGNTTSAGVFTPCRFVMQNYTVSGPLVFTALGGSPNPGFSTGNLFMVASFGIWNSTGPLTSIQFFPQGGGSFVSGTRIVARLLP